MKSIRAVIFMLAVALLPPISAKSAEIEKPVGEWLVPKIGVGLAGSPPVVPGPLKLPDASPVHKIEAVHGSIKVTFPNGQASEYGKKYIPLIINGRVIDADVLLVKDRTLAPLRALTEALGGTVDWDEATRSVTIHNGNDEISMAIGDSRVIVNGEETYIDVPPGIYNNFTYLPIRFVSEALGAQVTFNTGEYDSSAMKFNGYKLVQGVSANAVVDQHDPSWPVLSEFEAEAAVMSLSLKLFDGFSQSNSAEHPDKDYAAKYNAMLYNIDNTRLVGSVSRYYVVESFCLFLYDKYTGATFLIGSDNKSNWVRRYVEDDPENYKLLADIYFIN